MTKSPMLSSYEAGYFVRLTSCEQQQQIFNQRHKEKSQTGNGKHVLPLREDDCDCTQTQTRTTVIVQNFSLMITPISNRCSYFITSLSVRISSFEHNENLLCLQALTGKGF